MTDEKRVVLIKPGDLLVIGNVGSLTPEDHQELSDAIRALGMPPVVLFEGDVQLDALTAEQVEAMAAQSRELAAQGTEEPA